MSLFSFIGDAVDFVGDLFGAEDLGGSIIKTAGEFALGGDKDSQGGGRRGLPTPTRHGGVSTRRGSQPSSPSPPGVFNTDQFHAQWLARMNKFATLARQTETRKK